MSLTQRQVNVHNLCYIRLEGTETSYLSCNECEASELKQGSELYFSYLRFQYEHTMAKQETIVQII